MRLQHPLSALILLLVLTTPACAQIPHLGIAPATSTYTPPPTDTPRPTDTPTPPPTPTETPTPTPAPTTGEVQGELLFEGITVRLCDSAIVAPLAQTHCNGEFEQSVTTGAGGSFLFTDVPPGAYYILFDVPASMRDLVPPLCRVGEYYRAELLSEGDGRILCFHRETLGPTVEVVVGQTTHYSLFSTVVYPTSADPPEAVGTVAAGGNAVVVIVNDYRLPVTYSFSGPSSVQVEVEACETCEEYIGQGPPYCETWGRPQESVQLSPGVYDVSVSIGDYVVEGQWTLDKDTQYQSCFYLIIE